MKITIDVDKCIGSGSCEMIAPGILSSKTHKAVILFQPGTGAIADKRVQHGRTGPLPRVELRGFIGSGLQPPQVRFQP